MPLNFNKDGQNGPNETEYDQKELLKVDRNDKNCSKNGPESFQNMGLPSAI